MHHQRRKSGPSSGNTSTTDVRKSVTVTDLSKHKRPSMTRRHTPSNPQKLGRAHRERNEVWDNDERESFPQFCMTCEKQFVPLDDMFLYCSDACRRIDQSSPSQAATVRSYTSASYNYPYYAAGRPEPRDIIPRASPSRPNSMAFSNSPPSSPDTTLTHHTSAMSALRSLNVRPPSPPSPTGSSGIWPFSRSAATSPSNSYTRPSASGFSSTYDTGYGGAGAFTYSHDVGSAGMERPLPSRYPGGSSRPKNIDLVTPMLSR